MASTIRVALGVDGARDFQNAMKESNAAIKTLGSELKLTTAQFGDAAKSEEGLKAQNDVLERTVLTLKDKLAEQEKALIAVGNQFGESSVETQKFQQEVNKTKTEIANAENQINSNTQAVEDLGKEEEDASKKTLSFGDVLKANLISEAVVASVKAIGSAVKEVGSKLLEAATNAGYFADDLNTQAKVTGISTEQLQKYAFAAEQIDVSVDTIAGSMKKLTMNMDNARDGSASAAEAFEQLGISYLDANGELRSNDDVFADAIKALGEIENETERDAAAMELFGKSATELNPLILGGVDALEEYSEMAENAGLILSQDSLDSLNLISDAMDTFKGTASAAGNLFMTAFSTPISGGINTVTGYMQRLTAAFSNNGMDGLVTEAQSVFQELLESFDELLPQVMENGTEILMSAVNGILEAAPELLSTAVTLIVTLAEGIGNALPQLIPAAVNAIVTLATDLTSPDNLSMMISAALQLVLGLATGLIEAIPELVKSIPTIISNIVSALTSPENIAAVVDVGVQIVEGIWDGIKSMATWLWEQVTGFFGGIVDGVKETLGIHSPSKVFAGIGENMALGLGEGFDSAMNGVARTINDSMATTSIGSVNVAGGGADIVLNVTSTLDGNILARNQYRYNARETIRHGGSLVGGMA